MTNLPRFILHKKAREIRSCGHTSTIIKTSCFKSYLYFRGKQALSQVAAQSSRRPSCHWEDSFRKFDTGCSFILTSTPPFQIPHARRASMPVGGHRNYIAGNTVPIYCRDEYISTIWRRVYRAIWKDSEENTIRSPCVVPVPEFRVDRGSHVASYDRAMKISFFQSANYD